LTQGTPSAVRAPTPEGLNDMDENGPSTPADLASRETEQPKAPAPDTTSAEPDQVPGAPPAPPAPPVLPGATWPGPPTGRISPGAETGPRRGRQALLIGFLSVGALLIAIPIIAFATLVFDPSGSSGPTNQSIGFGRGGSECDLADQARTFPPGVPVRFVMTFSPSLPAGGTATMKLSKDGTELVDFRETYTAAGSTSCIHATYPSLEVGHYRLEIAISPSMMPPMGAEFDVTP
jgi:hypothetical protein